MKHLKKSEAIALYREKIAAAMREDYRYVLKSGGQIEYKIYIWEDGEVEELENVQGGNSWLQAKDCEDRKLYYVSTISCPCFDPWDYSEESRPDDDQEREKMESEIVDWLCSEYAHDVQEAIDQTIRVAEMDEKLDKE